MKKLLLCKNFPEIILILVIGIISFGCNKSNQKSLSVGESKLSVPGGNIWYKITGNGDGIPVVLLHGGPGMSSYYLKPFEQLGDDRQVIRYDQLGGGKSDKINDTTMFTIDHFVKELDLLREHLGIKKWHVFGHSWGTILAIEYYKVHPDKVASLIFGSAALSIPVWEKHAKELLTTLPDSLQQAVAKAESSGNFADSLYIAANNVFYSMYVFRNPVKEDLDSTFASFNESIYYYMQGPSEFTITGTLKNYDATSYLPMIKVPTLFTVGEFDEAGTEIIKNYSELVPNSRYVVFSGAAHITPWDAKDENVKVVREFLNSLDTDFK